MPPRTYEPTETGGVFAYGTHAVVVAVEPDTGVVEILDYAVSEDCGTMINPMIVDGQVQGGIAQGIGTALYEEIPYDEIGQPLATTFGDYMVPCAPEIPTVRIAHLVHPALATEYGVKGLGEGGAIAPPAAIANAVADAFRGIGASFNETPLTPRRVSEAVDRARRAKAAQRREHRGMKAAPFEYIRPKSVAEASVALGRRGADTAAIAGGQSLMPMLNLRVALIDLLVDISRLDDLKIVTETPDSLWLGALTTHAAIEDGKAPDIFGGLMRRVAGQISYRAVRNHGTIGGSVALADPAADWPCCLIALDASVRIVGRNGVRMETRRRFHPGLLRDDADHRRHHHGLRHPGAEGAAALGLRQGRAQERRVRPFDRDRRGARQGRPGLGGARRRRPAPPCR